MHMQCEFAPGKEKLRSVGIFSLTFSTKPPTFEDLPTGFAESLQQVVLINTCSFVYQAVVALFHNYKVLLGLGAVAKMQKQCTPIPACIISCNRGLDAE